MVLARDAVPGRLYRPTRSREVVGRSVLRRPTPGRVRAALRRLEARGQSITGQEAFILQRIRGGDVLFRLDNRLDGVTRSRWTALPSTYVLREVLR